MRGLSPWSPLPRTYEAALRDARHVRPQVRASAAADLGRLCEGPPRSGAVAQLQELLQDADPTVVAAAALALADSAAIEALPALLEAARGASPRALEMLLLAVGELGAGNPQARALARDTLEASVAPVRFQAWVAAGALLAREELARLLPLGFGDSDPRVRYLAVRIAEERLLQPEATGARAMLPPEVARCLEQLLSQSKEPAALAAALALAPLGHQEARNAVVAAINSRARLPADDEQAACDVCARCGLEAALPGLRARGFGRGLLPPGPGGFHARIALARMGDARARDAILRGLDSSNPRTRAQAVSAAGQAKLAAAVPRLRALRKGARGVAPETVQEALLALEPLDAD